MFPNLKANDAIQSAPESTDYNCISWSGGRDDISAFFWPPDWGNDWEAINMRNTPTHDLNSFDNFYMNRDFLGNVLPRDIGMVMDFYRAGSYSSSACVALWGGESGDTLITSQGTEIVAEGNVVYTHASLRKPGNNQPHGYDWESKPGGFMRTFHPKDALEGYGYGKIIEYYNWYGTYSSGTPPLKKSASAIASVDLSQYKKSILEKLVSSNLEKSKFDNLYTLWKDTWKNPELNIHSNPKMYSKSEEYKALLSFCKKNEESSWPLVFEKYVKGDRLNMLLIEDLTKESYSWLMDDIKKNKQLKIGLHPLATQNANYIHFIEAILGLFESDGSTNLDVNDIEGSVKIYPNPARDIIFIDITHHQLKNVHIDVYDLNGKIIKSIVKSKIEDNRISMDIGNFPTGTFIFRITIDNKISTKKFTIQR